MKRVAVILSILVGLSLYQSAYALPGLKLGIDANMALPQGDWSDTCGTGYGATAFAMFTLIPVVKLTAHAGYLKFQGKDFSTPAGDTEYNFSAIPILAGIRYYVLPLPKLYLGAQAGYHLFTVKIKLKRTGHEEKEHKNKFSFAPTVGVEFGPLEASIFYMIISRAEYQIDIINQKVTTANYTGFRLGIRF